MLKATSLLAGCLWLITLSTACRPSPEEPLSIAFTGDVLLDRGVREQIEKKGAAHLFTAVAPLFRQADATVINLECPVSSTHSPLNKRYIFRAEPVWMATLQQAGITHAALANNHTMDQGRSGLSDTYHHLKAHDITPIGYGANENESRQPVIIQKGNIRVALFNAVTLPLENWVYLDDSPGVNQQSIGELSKSIRDFKQHHPAHYVVAILHWGVEYQSSPSASQRRGARQLIKAGADAIIGHHPHVVQAEERIDGKPVFYSLGNFVFDQRRPETSRSEIVVLQFTTQQCTARIHPVTINHCKPELEGSSYAFAH